MVNIYDVAKKSNVSIATVSRVINNNKGVSVKTREKVLTVTKELNYDINIIAKSLVTKKTGTIGVIIPDITTMFFSMIVRGIEDFSRENNLNLIIGNSDNDVNKELYYLNEFNKRNVDGIIISCTERKKEQNKHIITLLEKQKPLVLIDRYIPDIYSSYVITNNIRGGYLAARHLIEQGHKKIALINGPKTISICTERKVGFIKALNEFNLNFDKKLEFFGDLDAKSGYEIMEKIHNSKNKVTAIFAICDLIAIGALKYLKDKKLLIPDDYAVVGFDNLPYSFLLKPNLTTIEQQKYLMGNKAANILIKNILNNTNNIEQIILEPKLIIRESTVKSHSADGELSKFLFSLK
ncbi:MAG: LacI family transcriptional regulator [Actinobacteria bacterium]|nr:LacI family transcriptional regulator [Actinomycetota bacterium]